MIKLLSKYIIKIREQGDYETLERTDAENKGLSNRNFMFIYFSIFHSGFPGGSKCARASLVAQLVTNLPAMQETPV